MRFSRLILAGNLCSLLVSCSVDYAGILAGKACDPSGACANGYLCDQSSWKCVPASEFKPGEDNGYGGDPAFQNDAGVVSRDHGVGTDGTDDVPDAGQDAAGDATPDGSVDAASDSSFDDAQDGSHPSDASFDGAQDGSDAGSDAGEDTGPDAGTDAGGCTPTPHAGTRCVNNDVFWVDSCGDVEEMKEDCTGPQVCFSAACCTPATCASLGKACGTWDDGCGGSVVCPACDGAKLCLEGTCRTVIFVKADATGTGDGTSWANAFTNVQDALDASVDGDEIWIAKGEYTRKNLAAEVAKLKEGVSVYGGFAGTEASLGERDLHAGNETIFKGESSIRVVTGAARSSLDGITITKGGFMGGYGGGVYLYNSSNVTIANCLITGNSATWGGGIFLSLSDADISNTTISANTAIDGGGIFNQNSTIRLTGDVISGNISQGSIGGGGGIFNDSAASTIVNCVFSGNTAQASFAGGIYNNYTSTHTVTNCTFYGNTSRLGGGAIFNNITASPVITNSIFWNDSPDEVYDYPGYGSHAQVRYCDIHGGNNGDGNINADPAFVDAGQQNFHLTQGSPCIDAADGDIAPPYDKDGAPRYDDPATANTGIGSPPYTDMGAFEYVPPPP